VYNFNEKFYDLLLLFSNPISLLLPKMKKLLEKYTLFWMGLGTLILFPLVAWLLLVFLPESWNLNFWNLFKLNKHSLFLVPTFISVGITFGLFVIWMTELDYFEESMAKYKNLLDNYTLNTFYVVFLSICAGVGEEIFFRGALQPLINHFSNMWI